jgi:hypothetical protein
MRHFYRMMTVIILTCIMLCGCSKENPPDKIADADFTVITGSDIPEELQSLINERKKNPFSLTFTDQSYLYVVRGYGKQSCGGYKITVNDFCKREDGLYFDTELFGPKATILMSAVPILILLSKQNMSTCRSVFQNS